eukprot:GEMP01076296.1.p1 GENE.GEMP01076296.1~~GEMP01076296.1.p1  ORF type:complete len:193 (+),score=41.49 GEMP01076296.1:141-719(+)
MGAPTRSVRVKLCFLRLFAYCLWATAGARFVYPLADKWAVVMQGVYLLINVAVCMSVLKDDPIVDLACRLLAKMPCGAEVQLGGMECLLPYASVCALQAFTDVLNYGDMLHRNKRAHHHEAEKLHEGEICLFVGICFEILLAHLSCSIYAELRRESTARVTQNWLLETGTQVTPFSGTPRRLSEASVDKTVP